MLQYGVFSSKERAELARKELQQYGIAAGQDPDQENRVYAGMSTDLEQAKFLSSQLKAQGLELYVREVMLPAASEMKFGGEAGTINEYFAVSSELVSKLSQLSAELLGQENPAGLSTEDTSAITDLHSRWMEAMKSLQTGLGPSEEEMGTQMEQTMNSAVSAITEYNRNHSKGHLWEVQSSMMQYIKQQKEMISKLEKV
nr:SPOR domain-containing protein [Paenibacillus mangrovi]